MKKILIVAAHPDDEILGCGGTVDRLIKEGHEAYTLILGEGITSRDDKRDINKRKNDLNNLKKCIIKANKIIGIKEVYIHDLPDNRFDTVALLDIIKIIENKIIELKPDIIFTHYENDLNIDHRITYQAVLTATRPYKDQHVKEIYSFEIPSSTEWNFTKTFTPNIFFDISNTIKTKINALKEYKTEIFDYPHPRSLKSIELLSESWAIKTGVGTNIEAFILIRGMK